MPFMHDFHDNYFMKLYCMSLCSMWCVLETDCKRIFLFRPKNKKYRKSNFIFGPKNKRK